MCNGWKIDCILKETINLTNTLLTSFFKHTCIQSWNFKFSIIVKYNIMMVTYFSYLSFYVLCKFMSVTQGFPKITHFQAWNWIFMISINPFALAFDIKTEIKLLTSAGKHYYQLSYTWIIVDIVHHFTLNTTIWCWFYLNRIRI